MKKMIAIILILISATSGIGCAPVEATFSLTEKETILVQEPASPDFSVLWSKSIYALDEGELRWMVEYCRMEAGLQTSTVYGYPTHMGSWLELAQLYQLELNRRWVGFYTDLRGEAK